MKPTSVIFIIVSVILACTGLLLCMSAENLAVEQGVALFNQQGDSENNYTESFDIDEEYLKKIVISLNDVSVNVYGGAEKSHIDLINFNNGSYDLTSSKSQLNLSDISGISGLINLDTFKINFDGFRNYLNYWKYRNKDRTVNLYLSDAAAVISVEIQTQTGDIMLSDLAIDCDYELTANEGSVTVNNVSTISTITVDSSKETVAKLKGVSARELIFTAASDGYVEIEESSFTHKIDVSIKNGDFKYVRTEPDFSGFNVSLNASGIIDVYGKSYSGSFSEQNVEISLRPITPTEETGAVDAETTADSTPETEAPTGPEEANSITVTVKNGNITITGKN